VVKAWVLVHIEIQGQKKVLPSGCLFTTTASMTLQTVSRNLAGLVTKSWRPNQFGYELWGVKFVQVSGREVDELQTVVSD